MADRLSNFSSTYFTYANYWRPSVNLGKSMSHSRSLTKTDKLDMRHTWQIIPIASCVIIAVTLVIGIYNIVLYRNVASTNFLATTSETTTTTTAATNNRAGTAGSTIDSGTTTSSTTTTAITTVAINTTSAAVSTDVVTTKTPQICPSILPFGKNVGDQSSSLTSTFPFNCSLWNTETGKGNLQVYTVQGVVLLTAENYDQLEIRTLWGVSVDPGWHGYFRNVSSKAEQDAIACLVKNYQPGNAFVVTWMNNITKELQVCQLIIASFNQSGTYIIRIYSENLPESSSDSPVRIRFRSKDGSYEYFADAKIADVAGQRQIFDVSKTLHVGQDLTVVEEGKNCGVFIC